MERVSFLVEMCAILLRMRKPPKIQRRQILVLGGILLILLVFGIGSASGYLFGSRQGKLGIFPSTQEDIYLVFLAEVYDKIQENYWDFVSDEQLSHLFQLGAEKLTGSPRTLKSNDKEGVKQMVVEVIKDLDEGKKKEFTVQLVDIVLANLKPFGHSRLYTQKLEQDLKNQVSNINPDVDQYDVLGVKKEASQDELKLAYEKKVSELEPKKDESEEAKQEYERVQQAYNVLGEEEDRKIYDESGVEPTMDYKLIRPQILWLHLNKFSPTTFDELKRVTEKVDKGESLDTLILDLRDNIGGAIDGLPYFLGPFIGAEQYAYQFYHQGEKTDFKTRIGWLPSLVRYKKVVVLVNEGTQSSAEVMAATLKRYNVGVVVGAPTKGWGTVEKVFALDTQIDPNEKYSMFLVHSLTLRDDGEPIQDKGVDPLININDAGWESQLMDYFNYPDLVTAIKEILQS
jgi:hypothetical protein